MSLPFPSGSSVNENMVANGLRRIFRKETDLGGSWPHSTPDRRASASEDNPGAWSSTEMQIYLFRIHPRSRQTIRRTRAPQNHKSRHRHIEWVSRKHVCGVAEPSEVSLAIRIVGFPRPESVLVQVSFAVQWF